MNVKSYDSTSDSRLTDHFRVSEFRCRCGKNHKIKVDMILTEKLEKLHSALKCSKIIVNSGYRCESHDKSVGGSGSGQHTKGKAADIICYDKAGKIISSRIVTCAAQDIGFSGISNIDAAYTVTHLDTAERKWYGDETLTVSKSVTADFYKYWGLSSEEVYGKMTSEAKRVSLIIDGITYEGTLMKK